ncbi:MAG: hypothetical protein HYV15_05225, partial [Elusimicrobia bacterium]|nr:hypothetical protein [Elusimicrobiota bacterium]
VTGLLMPVCDRASLDLSPGAQNAGAINGGSCYSRESETLGSSQQLLTFHGTRGQILDATMESDEDNYLYLYDEHGQLVAQADEGGAKQGDARLQVTLPGTGDYTLAATFFAPGIGGAYKIALQNSGGTPGSSAGEVLYSGSQGGTIVIGLFNQPDFDSEGAFVDGRELPGPGVFSFANLASETSYYMGSFVDVNFNHSPDQGEDFAVFSTAPPAATPIFLRAGQEVTGLSLVINPSTAAYAGLEGRVTGVISYTGPRQGVLRVEFWPDSTFAGRPLAVRAIPTGVGPYDLSVPGGQPYAVRAFLDVNNDFIPNPDEPMGVYSPNGQGAEPIYVPANAARDGVDFAIRDPGFKLGQDGVSGEGFVAINSTLAAAGSSQVFFSSFVVGPSGIGAGGAVAFGVPFGWTPPQADSAMTPGYTTVAVVPAGPSVSTQAAPGGAPGIIVRVGGTPLAAGSTVQFLYNAAVPCFTGPSQFFFGSASTQTAPPAPLFSGNPIVEVTLGAAASVHSAEPFIGLIQGATSQRLLLEAVDLCGNRAPVASAANVVLRAKRFSYQTAAFVDEPGLKVSSSIAGVFDSTAVVTFAAGRSSATYRLRADTAGDLAVEIASNLLAPGTTGYAGVFALAVDPLTGVRVSTVPDPSVAQTTVTIRPDGSPLSPNLAFINFNRADQSLFWTVAIASTPYKTDAAPNPVAFCSGLGQPARGQIAW